MNRRDLSGQRFGRLVALSSTEQKDKWGKCFLWHCRCDCGKTCAVSTYQLRAGSVRSCGCLQAENRMRDVTGKRYGRLVALEYTGKIVDNSTVWRFRCDCGNEISVRLQAVRYSNRRSCGCLERENKVKQALAMQEHIIRTEGTNINALRSDVMFRHNTSGYRGVTWHKRMMKFQAKITFRGKCYHLGTFSDPKEASEAYQAARNRLHKEFLEKWESRNTTPR